MMRWGYIRLGGFVVWCAFVAFLSVVFPGIAQASELHTTATATNTGLTVEAYLQNSDTETTTVKPTDYIFVLDQSQWMNGTNGAQREAIIETLHSFVDHLEQPTFGENRFAIAGYGRINVGGNADPYDATLYPGVKPSNNTSLNTGYYTASGFKSYKGWTEVSNYTSSDLPTVPTAQFSDASYDDIFMTVDQAQTVLNPSTMNAWYSGASRMDAGLAVAEKIADIAKDHDPDRNLMIVFVSSSLPILNRSDINRSYVRAEAVIEASKYLKNEGATILALTNYHPSDRVIASGLADTEENFDKVMSELCSKSDYYFPIKDNSSLARVLSNLVTEVSIVSAGDAAVTTTIVADTFERADGSTETWSEYAAGKESAYARAYASVSLYDFTGFDSSGTPEFSYTPRLTYQVPVSSLIENDAFSWTTDLVPVPDADTFTSADVPYGAKVVVTITQPLAITYAWGTDTPVPTDVTLPTSDVLLKGEEFFAPTPKSENEHYRFLGWYTNAECTNELSGDAVIYTDMTLYGKWEKDVVVKYYWNPEDPSYDYFDSEEIVTPGTTPDLPDFGELDGKKFAGWYTDKDFATPYVPGPANSDLNLYAKWVDVEKPDEPATDEPGTSPDDDASSPDEPTTKPDDDGSSDEPESKPDDNAPSDEGSATKPDEDTSDESGDGGASDTDHPEDAQTPEASEPDNGAAEKDEPLDTAGTGANPSTDAEAPSALKVKPSSTSAAVPDTGVAVVPVAPAALFGLAALAAAFGMRRR